MRRGFDLRNFPVLLLCLCSLVCPASLKPQPQDRKPVREFEKIEHIQDSNLQRGAGSDHCVWLRSLELLAITQLRTQAIITAMGTLLYPRPITTIPVSVTCHPWARSASRS